MREMYSNAADISPTSPDRSMESSMIGENSTADPFYDRFPWFRPIGRWKIFLFIYFSFISSIFFRTFVYLTNLLYGIPLIQNVAIVSERGEIKGYLKISIEQIQTSTASETTNEQIKLMKTYRNACGLTKIVFDDETYFQVLENNLIKIKLNFLFSRKWKTSRQRI